MSVRPFLASVVLVVLTAAPAFPSHGAESIAALAIDPKTPTTVYAGTSDRGVFKSIDGGANWSATGLANIYASALAIDSQAPSVVYAGTDGGAGVSRVPTEEEPGRSHGPQRRAARHRSPDSHHDLCIGDGRLSVDRIARDRCLQEHGRRGDVERDGPDRLSLRLLDRRNVESWHHVGTTSESGTPDVSEVPDFGGPSRTRTLDPLIKSDPRSISTENQDAVKLEDLYTWD